MKTRPHLYILQPDHSVVACDDLMVWARTFETTFRNVNQSYIGDVKISTVFLGVDHNYCADGPPLVFETMIFGGQYDQYQERCSTYLEACKQHDVAVRLVKRSAYGRWIRFKTFLSILITGNKP